MAGRSGSGGSAGSSVAFDHPDLQLDDMGVLRHKATGRRLTDVEISARGPELLEQVVEYVQKRMKKELDFEERWIPNDDAEAKCAIFVSKNYESADKLLVFVSSSRGLQPGIWSRSLVIRSGLNQGSMIPYFEAAKKEGYGIVVLNPNSTFVMVNDANGAPKKLTIEGASTQEQHVEFVWSKFIQPSSAKKIALVSYGYGGHLIKVFLGQHLPEILPRFAGAIFIESSHRVNDDDDETLKQILKQRTTYWESSEEEFGKELGGVAAHRTGCASFSAGKTSSDHANAAYTIQAVMKAAFKFYDLDGHTDQFSAMLRARASSADEATNGDDSLMPSKSYDKLSVEDFELLKVVGKGAFGKVMLVRKKEGVGKGQIYAMKVLTKAAVFATKQVDHTNAERRILKEISHPFIVQLRFAFQSVDKLYIVMDYYSGGSLFFHLRKSKHFDEERARFYAAELLLALKHLHDCNIAYRDLKLENILMDREGHVALTDFGLSKENVDLPDTATTFCGTAEYIAPELLLNHPYGKAVDWWSYGILLFEMLSGTTPFFNPNRKQMFHNILHAELKFPRTGFSDDAKSLLTELLRRDPTKRLGTGPHEANEIMDHPFFSDIDWSGLLQRKTKPPFKPETKDDLDTTNVAAVFTAEPVKDTPVVQRLNPQNQAAFEGFTYVGEGALGK